MEHGDWSLHDTETVHLYIRRFSKEVAALRDRFSVADRHDQDLERAYRNPTDNSDIYSVVKGLRRLSRDDTT